MKKKAGKLATIIMIVIMFVCAANVSVFADGYQTLRVGETYTVKLPYSNANCCMWSVAGNSGALQIISSYGRTCKVKAVYPTKKYDAMVHCTYFIGTKPGINIYDCFINVYCLEHRYDGGTLTRQPSCKSTGNIQYTCTLCESIKNETIPKTNSHSYGKPAVTKEATCAETGVQKYTCIHCGNEKTEEIAKSENHVFDNGKITKEATCGETGTKVFTCTLCGKEKTEEIAKNDNHVFDKGKITKEATCAETGMKTYTCSHCGKEKTEEIAKNENHVFDNGMITKEASCAETGIKTFTCNICGKTKTEELEKTDEHVNDIIDEFCDVCGKKLPGVLVEGMCGNDVSWKIDGSGTLTISGMGEMLTTPWKEYRSLFKKIIVSEGVTNICDSAFEFDYCPPVPDVDPANESVDDLISEHEPIDAEDSEMDFDDCPPVPDVDPTNESVDDIIVQHEPIDAEDSEMDFDDCPPVPDVDPTHESVDDIISEHESGKSVDGQMDFYDSFNLLGVTDTDVLTDVSIANSVKRIGKNSFANCSHITALSIPDGVTVIADNAFYNCENLSEVQFSDSLTELGDNAFKDCRSLTSVTLPGTLSSTGQNTFENCSSLDSVILSEGIKAIGNGAFANCSQLDNVVLPNSIELVNQDSFDGCGTIGHLSYCGSEEKLNELMSGCPEGLLQNAEINYVTKIISATEISVANSSSDNSFNVNVSFSNGVENSEAILALYDIKSKLIAVKNVDVSNKTSVNVVSYSNGRPAYAKVIWMTKDMTPLAESALVKLK